MSRDIETGIKEESEWGSKTWFDYLFASQGERDPAAYYAHQVNGYQIYRHRRLVSFLEEFLRPTAKTAMLDIGCGTGELTNLIARRFGFEKVVGLDFVVDMLKTSASRLPGMRFSMGHLPDLPFRTSSFDLVVASEVLYYLSEDGRRTAFEEIERVLKVGGGILFSSVLGEEYFSAQTALAHIGRHFEQIEYRFDHNRTYHLLSTPFYRAKRIEHFLRTGIKPGHTQSVRKLQRFNWILERRTFYLLLRVICAIADPFLRISSIPAFLETVSRRCFPAATQTNITVVARKSLT